MDTLSLIKVNNREPRGGSIEGGNKGTHDKSSERKGGFLKLGVPFGGPNTANSTFWGLGLPLF